jgi:predicted DCC family thiol-disulfide oxidoreductase YuxK
MSVSEVDQIGDRLLVVFDGHCVLCNRAVRWFLRRDRRDRLRFVAFKSTKVAELLARHGIGMEDSGSEPGSILVVEDGERPTEKLLVRSDAVVAMLSELPRP